MLAEIANNEFITHMFIMEYIYMGRQRRERRCQKGVQQSN